MMRESDFQDKLFKSNPKSHMRQSVLNEELDQMQKSDNKLDEAVYLNMRRANDRYNYRLEMIPDPATVFELTSHDETAGYIEVPNVTNNSVDHDL
jgi:hypothetical protein